MKFHTIHSISVKDCQQMIISADYMMICKGKSINPFIKVMAKNAYQKFIEELRGLFGGEEELGKMIDLDVLVQGMRIKRQLLTNLHKGLECCYLVKDTPEKIQALDKLKEQYRKIYFDYPKLVDANADAETQKKQMDIVLKPIQAEVERLEYKIKELSPKPTEKPKEEQQSGLELHILIIQAMNPEMGYIDRSMSVYSLSQAYESAVKKNNKLKAKQ
jgi:hypothetical protein